MYDVEAALYKKLAESSALATLLPGNRHSVTISEATGGTFTLTYQAKTTAAIAWNATALAVQTALAALTTVGAGNVSVSGSAGGPWVVSFVGDLLDSVAALTADGTLLEGAGHAIAVQQYAAVYNPAATQAPAAYAVLQLVTGSTEYIFGPARASRRWRYQVSVYNAASSIATVAKALDAVEAVLDGQALTVSSQTVWGVTKASDNPSGAMEDGGVMWVWGSSDYYVDLGS